MSNLEDLIAAAKARRVESFFPGNARNGRVEVRVIPFPSKDGKAPFFEDRVRFYVDGKFVSRAKAEAALIDGGNV